ncbi:MAG: hypothetical protein PQJ59_07575 [Spirochaetales bacterium]|nr:hypothetical protein [Spirochaetales bacterium]
MPKFLLLMLIIIISEFIVAFFYMLLAQILYKKSEFDIKSILKGAVERIFLVITFSSDYKVGLTFFSALKLATRIKHDEANPEETNKFNDYYLIGNLISVLIALGYTYICQNIEEIPILMNLLKP